MGKEGEESSQRTCMKEPWRKLTRGGLDVGDGGWVGWGRVMG